MTFRQICTVCGIKRTRNIKSIKSDGDKYVCTYCKKSKKGLLDTRKVTK